MSLSFGDVLQFRHVDQWLTHVYMRMRVFCGMLMIGETVGGWSLHGCADTAAGSAWYVCVLGGLL